jgi:uncharacterized membrane protein YwzB
MTSCFNASFLKSAMIFLAIVSVAITTAFVVDYVDSSGGWDTVATTFLK